MMVIDASEIKKAIKPKADSTLNNMKKSELIEYIRCLENNYNTAVWFNENQARYIEKIGIENVRSQWISVKERLPEESGPVLAYDTGFGVIAAYYHADMISSAWQNTTHWMPLPEPPAVQPSDVSPSGDVNRKEGAKG